MTFEEQVAAALNTNDPNEAGERVHQVVMDEIVRLDPSVKPVVTGYFNHSYVPDIVVEWHDGKTKGERPVYLRHSLQSSRASGDLESLSRLDKSALFMSLSLEEPVEEVRIARAAVQSNIQARSLITTVPALDELTKPLSEPDPVLSVVRASVIRSAKGFIQESDVERIVLPRSRRTDESDLEIFNETVQASFSEEAVYRINRVSTIVEQALAEIPDTSQLFDSGQLSEPELRELIPYLLGLEGVTQSREFWQGIARLISLEVIERHWLDFAELDLTPLAAAASDTWRATRAQLAIRSESIDSEEFDLTPRWGVTGKTLAAEVGNWRITYAHTPTKLKASGRNLVSARWVDLKPALADYTVTGIDLSGVVTQSQYGAVQPADMKTRIDTFIEGADDSFHVPGVTVATGTGDDLASVKADFTEMLLVASPSASVATLTQAALDILGYRTPVEAEDVANLLGRNIDDALPGS